MEFLELTRKRYAVRNFEGRPVDEAALIKILQAAQAAPTGRNAQPWKIYVLHSPSALKAAAACTPCTYNAPAVLLFCYDTAHPESSLKENSVNVGLTDVCIAADHAMLEATELGLGSCWVCLFYEETVEKLFSLPEGWKPACFLPIGYAAAEPNPRHFIRKELSELAEFL